MKQNDLRLAEMTQSGLNLIGQAISIYDADLRLAVSNSRFREMFDLPSAMTKIGAGFDDLVRYLAERGEYGGVDDIEGFVAARVQQAQRFEAHYMERQRANGRWISVEGAPLHQGGWVAVYTDITDIKRQEELLRSRSEQLSDELLTRSEELSRSNRALAATISALEEAKRELTEAEARTRLTTEMMPAHIARVNLDEIYLYSNGKLRSILPDAPAKITGLPMSEAVGKDAYERIRPYMYKAFQGNASAFEFTHSPTGRRIRTAFTSDYNANGDIVGAFILTTDITEETQTRIALMHSRKRELAAQLTSGLVHDFSNLLTIIIGLQDTLMRSDLTTLQKEKIAATKAAALRGGELLTQVSAMSGGRNLIPVATKLEDFLKDLQPLMQASLPPQITLDIKTDLLSENIMIDPGYLQDSLLNLILNARDAIGEAGTITLSVKTLQDIIEIEVKDSGPGFETAALTRGFDPFFTTKSGKGGTGLGLTTVYDFAKLSGGHVKLSNHKNGASVSLSLPLKFAPLTPSSYLILLVEDQEDLRSTVREMLCQLGHRVLEASSAEEAETLAKLDGIDFILSDINLEGPMNGIELAKHVSCPVCLMTGLDQNDPKRDGAALFPILQKPFTKSRLQQKIAEVFDL